VSGAPVVFLDANVLFSACLGGPSFALLIRLGAEGHVTLVTSTDCEREARANLERKHPEAVAALDGLLDRVSALDHDLSPHREWAAALVHPGDVHVLAAARAAGAAALVTGDSTHFGRLMEREDLDLRVHTVRAFLEAGPAGL